MLGLSQSSLEREWRLLPYALKREITRSHKSAVLRNAEYRNPDLSSQVRVAACCFSVFKLCSISSEPLDHEDRRVRRRQQCD